MSGVSGIVHYSEPRAVQLRVNAEGEITPQTRDSVPHSAVRIEAFIFTGSVSEAQEIMNRWPDIMAELDATVKSIIDTNTD